MKDEEEKQPRHRRIYGAGYYAGLRAASKEQPKNTCCWGILERETGYIDGWYRDLKDVQSMCSEFYAVERPQYTHVVINRYPGNIQIGNDAGHLGKQTKLDIVTRP